MSLSKKQIIFSEYYNQLFFLSQPVIYQLLLIKLMEQQRPNIESMWGCMFAGDLEIQQIGDKGILVVGDSRVGKSTLFNYILDKPMVGKKVALNVIYQPLFEQGVTTAHQYQSVTLVPNSESLQVDNQQVKLIDMAGFRDEKRSYVGIFGVSYMLQKVLQKLESMKFILAVPHNKFLSDQLKDFINPFQNFIRILNIDTLLQPSCQDKVKSFFNSIALVVVRAQDIAQNYLEKIKSVIQELQSEDTNQRKIVCSLLDSICKSGRIEVFNRAVDKLQPEKSTIIENLSDKSKNWNFYNFEKQNNLNKKLLFQLPFQKDFKQLVLNSKESYKQATEKKKKDIQNSYLLLNDFAKKAVAISKKTQNQSQDSGDDQPNENWFKNTIDYSQQFQKLQELIKNHPYGSSMQAMLDYLGVLPQIDELSDNNLTRLALLNSFQKINDEIIKIVQINIDGNQKTRLMVPHCNQILNICRLTFCKNKEQQQKFLIFMFIHKRSLYEVEMQNKIDNNQGSSIIFTITQRLCKILPDTFADLSAKMITRINPRPQQTQEYEKKLAQLVQIINQVSDLEIGKRITDAQMKFVIKKSLNLIKQQQYREALETVAKGNKSLHSYLSLISQDDQNQDYFDLVYFKQRQIFKIIGECLQKLKLNAYAIKVYEHIKAVHLLLKCHERIIKQKAKKQDKRDAMQAYGSALLKYGKKERAIELYEQMIDEFECFPEWVRLYKERVAKLLNDGLKSQTNAYISELKQNSNKVLEDGQLITDIIAALDQQYGNPDDDANGIEEDFDLVFKTRKDNLADKNKIIIDS